MELDPQPDVLGHPLDEIRAALTSIGLTVVAAEDLTELERRSAAYDRFRAVALGDDEPTGT